MLNDVAHYSGEILDPGEVPIQVKKVNFGLAYVPTAVNRVPRFSVIVVEPDHVDRDVEPLLDPREVNRTYGILNHIKPVLRKVRIRVSSWSIDMSVWIVRKKSRQNRVAKTALVILDVDDRLIFREELGKLLETAPLKRIELRDLKGDRVDLGEY